VHFFTGYNTVINLDGNDRCVLFLTRTSIDSHINNASVNDTPTKDGFADREEKI
jgi:hypothetical protein